METIRPFRVRKRFLKFLKFFGIFSFVLGVILLVRSFDKGFNTSFRGGDWSCIVIIVQGLLFFALAYSQSKYEKYFIEWDNTNLRYLMPGDKQIISIPITDILEINFLQRAVSVKTREGVFSINLRDVILSDLKEIKERLELMNENYK